MCLEKRAGAHLHTCAWVSFCKQCAYTYMLRRGDRALISRVSRVVRDDTRESEEFSVVCCGRVRIVISVLASGRGVHSTDSIVSRMLSLWPVFAHPHLFGRLGRSRSRRRLHLPTFLAVTLLLSFVFARVAEKCKYPNEEISASTGFLAHCCARRT